MEATEKGGFLENLHAGFRVHFKGIDTFSVASAKCSNIFIFLF